MVKCFLCLSLVLAAPGSEAESFDVEQVASLLELVLEADEDTAVECLAKIIQQIQSGELKQAQLPALKARLGTILQPIWSDESTKPLHDSALQLAALWNDPAAIASAKRILADASQPSERRGRMLSVLAATGNEKLVSGVLINSKNDPALQLAALNALAKFEKAEVAGEILAAYPHFPPQLQAQAITVLTQRPTWARQLVLAVQAGKLPATAVGLSHLRSLMASRDSELAAMVKKQWGAVRTERNPAREQVIAKMRELLQSTPGNAVRGHEVFHRVCGQCHKIHGKGQEVGPDITSNGRSNFDQLLSNVFDPSLVIGPAYQAITVITVDGRVLTGLLAEDSEQRVVLKTQGGKTETIPRGDVEELAPSKLSLMPENLEQQLKADELADLFAFLVLDKPPQDPEAKLISGAPAFNSAK